MNHGKRNQLLAAEAADWVIALPHADRETRKAFAAWLRTSPEHIREFLTVSAIWGALPELSSQPPVEELVRMAAAQPNVVEMPAAHRRPLKRTPGRDGAWPRWMGRAAVVLAAVAAGAILFFLPPADSLNLHATMTGEQLSVPLPDGSMVTLNTRSTVRVAYSERYRDVHLIDGEAFFEAPKDLARPFRVITERAVIEAVGTQFNVRKNAGEVTVTVVEGVVDVSAVRSGADAAEAAKSRVARFNSPNGMRLKVGQQARLQADSGHPIVVDAEVEKAIAWRERRLLFDALPLKAVIEEFNRYNDPPVVIQDKQLELLPISGVFRSDDRDSFLQFLLQMQVAEVSTRAGGSIVITSISGD